MRIEMSDFGVTIATDPHWSVRLPVMVGKIIGDVSSSIDEQINIITASSYSVNE